MSNSLRKKCASPNVKTILPLSLIRARVALEIQERYFNNPLRFVEDLFPWEEDEDLRRYGGVQEWQRKVLNYIGEKINSGEEKIYIAVASGNGVGKTTLTAWLEIWFLCCYTDSKSITTSARYSQLLETTWKNVRIWAEKFLLKGVFDLEVSATKIKVANQESWYGHAKSWNASKPESFQGEHRSCQKITFDEASGIDDRLYECLLGAKMSRGRLKLFIFLGNLTRNTGAFYDIFYKDKRSDILKMHVDVRDVSMHDPKEVQNIIDQFGEDSDEFRVRVQGLPPLKGENSFFHSDDIDCALRSWNKIGVSHPQAQITIGVDVATGEGEDYTCIAVRKDNLILDLDVFRGDNHETVSRIIRIYNYHGGTIYIDAVGVGSGICQELQHRGLIIIKIYGQKRSCDPALFFNTRAELYCRLRNWLKEGCASSEDGSIGSVAIKNCYTGIREDFLRVRSTYDEKTGAVKILPKDKNGKSTDIADAISYTFAAPNIPISYANNAPARKHYYKPIY